MRLENKTAVVTGASSGLGRSIAAAFSREGAKVLYSDIHGIEGFQPTERAAFKLCDVSKRVEVDELVSEAVSRFGGLDIMVNNAGVGTLGSITDTDDETWDRTLAVNLSGVFYGTRAAARYMQEHGVAGSIINMSSILGGVGLPGAAAYCASKGGVVQVTRAAALDLAGSGIRVNAIAPGFIKTNMTKAVEESPEFLSMVKSNTPMGYMGEDTDIANAAVYLASVEAKYVTGEVLFVDGGWMAR